MKIGLDDGLEVERVGKEGAKKRPSDCAILGEQFKVCNNIVTWKIQWKCQKYN
jgi:hypothetical protein